MTDSTLVTVGWVARRLALAEGTVRKMADRGTIPFVRLSDGCRWFNAGVIEQLAPQFAKVEYVPQVAGPRKVRTRRPTPDHTPAAPRPAAPSTGTV